MYTSKTGFDARDLAVYLSNCTYAMVCTEYCDTLYCISVSDRSQELPGGGCIKVRRGVLCPISTT